MTTALATTTPKTSLIQFNESAYDTGQLANEYAKAGVFAEYEKEQAENTIRRQRGDLAVFAEYLCAAGLFECPDETAGDKERQRFFSDQGEKFRTQPENWRIVTHGLVKGFRLWMEKQGYAIGSINVRLSTVKKYSELAFGAGILTEEQNSLIHTVKGYSRKAAKKVDEKREVKRTGSKKEHAVTLTKSQADRLKAQPDTPQGRRDAVIMALLLDHGLRVGELAGLQVAAFNLKEKTFTFYRQKVNKTQTHRLTADTLAAVRAWLTSDAPAMGPLLRGSRKGGHLTEAGMTERSLTDRVRVLGEEIGVSGLSAHDCRHYWATRAARQGTDPFALQEAGGWSSLAMPRRYVEAAKIANEGVKL